MPMMALIILITVGVTLSVLPLHPAEALTSGGILSLLQSMVANEGDSKARGIIVIEKIEITVLIMFFMWLLCCIN